MICCDSVVLDNKCCVKMMISDNVALFGRVGDGFRRDGFVMIWLAYYGEAEYL